VSQTLGTRDVGVAAATSCGGAPPIDVIGIETTDRDLSTPDDVVSPSVLTGLQAIVPQVLPRSTGGLSDRRNNGA